MATKIPTSMRAARFYAHHDIRVEEIPVPKCKETDVLVAVEWCGICGSDLHEYTSGPIAIPTPERPSVSTGEVLPVTMGHEFCGRVASAPAGSKLKVGDAVMADPRLFCHDCSGCNMNTTNICEKLGFLGLTGGGGGLSEYVAVDEKKLYAIPENSLHVAALIEPLAVAMHGTQMAEIKNWKETSALVIGGGPIGLAVSLCLKTLGAKQIFLSEPSETRKTQAAQITDRVFNPIKENVGEEIRRLTGGKGVDVTFDCAGIKAGLMNGMDALRRRGLYVNLAAWEKPFEIPTFYLLLKELKVVGSMGYNEDDYAQVVKLFTEGRFEGLENLVTSRIFIDDVKDGGFEQLENRRDFHIKIMVTPQKKLLSTT